jgi:hypothetical protein
MSKKYILIGAIAATTIGMGMYLTSSWQKSPPRGPITISGETTCLPKVGIGPETAECALGLISEDGNYYGFKSLYKVDQEHKFFREGLKIEVSGTLLQEEMRGPDGKRYDIIGVIDIASIRESEELSAAGECRITGCSREICSEEDVVSICIFLPEHVCYRTARCERQPGGECGWTMTEELKACLAETRN